MQMFKASTKSKNIECVQVEKIIKNFVIINGKSKLAHTGTVGYFDSFIEAKEWLLKCLGQMCLDQDKKCKKIYTETFAIEILSEDDLLVETFAIEILSEDDLLVETLEKECGGK